MKLKYKIVESWPKDGIIVVRFFSDELPELSIMSSPDLKEDGSPVRCRTDVAISVPLPLPSFSEVEKLIWLQCPIVFFETQQKILNPDVDTTLSIIEKKLNKKSKAKTIEDIKNDNALYHSKKLKETTMADVLTAEEIEEITKNL